MRATWRLLCVMTVLAALLLLVTGAEAGPSDRVTVLTIKGVINPVVARYINHGVARAVKEGDAAVVIAMDTPGGLDTSMRAIVQTIVNSQVPVVVYVSPSGARAASAGVFISMAAHVAAMAPSTNIGAAHPVNLGGGEESATMTAKVTNDAVALVKGLAERNGRNAEWAERAVRESVSATATEAVNLKVVDLISPSLEALLQQVDGRTVQMVSGPLVLHTAGAATRPIGMTWVQSLLYAVSDPTIAYVLMMIGIYGLIFEVTSPGAVLPGVIGGVSLVLGLFALGTLPINWAGLALIALAFILFIADIIASSHGVLTTGAILALFIGSLLLLDRSVSYLRISLPVIVAFVLCSAAFSTFVVGAVVRSRRRRVTTGRESLKGTVGEARSDLTPEGMVFVEGELWRAQSWDGETIRRGARVEVVRIEGLALTVRALSAPQADPMGDRAATDRPSSQSDEPSTEATDDASPTLPIPAR